MTVIADLKRLSAAEEFFDYLGVPYEPQVLDVNRLHVLRLVGNWLAASAPAQDGDDALVKQRFRDQLTEAYAALTEQGPLSQRLFKVHKDAIAPKHASETFVPLSTLSAPTPDGASSES